MVDMAIAGLVPVALLKPNGHRRAGLLLALACLLASPAVWLALLVACMAVMAASVDMELASLSQLELSQLLLLAWRGVRILVCLQVCRLVPSLPTALILVRLACLPVPYLPTALVLRVLVLRVLVLLGCLAVLALLAVSRPALFLVVSLPQSFVFE
jgi:hypothetical protein